MRVVYLKSALRDLEVIRTYIAREDVEAARLVVARIERSVERLANFPYSGRPGPRGTRLLSVPGLPYVVIHRVQGETVKIAAVFHTARNRRFR
jgi:toxin ParE1/3/4